MVYTRILEQQEKTQADIDSLSLEAKDIITARYTKLKIDLTEVNRKAANRHLKIITEFSIIEGLLYYQHPHYGEVLCIPEIFDSKGVNHRRRVFDESHAVDYVGHRGIYATKVTMRNRYYWDSLIADTVKMVRALRMVES
eukprot:COSAG05_NODE_2303_length_3249_cov_2110.047287_3_plen_140_part_00